MHQTIYEPTRFEIVLKDRVYPCQAFDCPMGLIFRVEFGKSCLTVTKAKGAKGQSFWTSLPEDTKINALVQELGQVIEQTFKNL